MAHIWSITGTQVIKRAQTGKTHTLVSEKICRNRKKPQLTMIKEALCMRAKERETDTTGQSLIGKVCIPRTVHWSLYTAFNTSKKKIGWI